MNKEMKEIEALIDALYNFTNVFNVLATNTDAKNDEKAHQALIFIKSFYDDLAKQVLQHEEVNTVLTTAQIGELNKHLKGDK